MMADVKAKLFELIGQVQDCGCDVTDVVEMNYVENTVLVDHLIAHGVTVPEQGGCEYCLEDSDGYRRGFGAFSLHNPFHANEWEISTGHCKPRKIYFCPMCGRKLAEPPMEVAEKDLVEVVRCKDCRGINNEISRPEGRYLCERISRWVFPDDYCSLGERK